MPSRAIWVRRILSSTHDLPRPLAPPRQAFWGALTLRSKPGSSRPTPRSTTVRNVHSHTQLEPEKEATPSQPDSLWVKSPWLENRQLAHPRYTTSHEKSLDNVRVGITWFIDEAESFVSFFPSAIHLINEMSLKGCLAKTTILRLTSLVLFQRIQKTYSYNYPNSLSKSPIALETWSF